MFPDCCHSKTEILLIGSKHQLAKMQDNVDIQIGSNTVSPADTARNIGAVLDCHMKLESQINNTCRAAHFQLRNIRTISKYLPRTSLEVLFHAFVTSRLDHLNSLLIGLPNYLLAKLQRVQNTAARILTNTPRQEHITPTLRQLHWLPVKFCIDFKILLMTFKCLNNEAPQYLCDLLTQYSPQRSLRSADKHYLVQPRSRTQTFGDHTFSVTAPKLWNALPIEIQTSHSVGTFKTKLKTHFFKLAFETN